MSARDVVAVYQYLLTSLNQTSQQTVLTPLANAQLTVLSG
jgi:hypothetical protein